MASCGVPQTPSTVTSEKVHKTFCISADEKLDFYEKWAESYDQDVQNSGYEAPRLCAEAIGEVLMDKSVPVIDCAAGTGIVGEELAKVGFVTIDAVDYSQRSLDISASKGVYKRLICSKIDSNKIQDIADGAYGGLICVGALLLNDITHEAFPEWNRIVKKGGFMVFTLSKIEYDDDLPNHRVIIGDGIQKLIDNNIWELVNKTTIPYHSGYLADMFTIRLL
ncbi:methyltransferase-like protein 27 [Acanthaster planci]|uniref:Methyltransferase-like protein 27 n=1 Tax=Acanthaster planci TaxID=133434 RepID=A0A8B7XWJ6_ACAPL|nr:methyltransferase-like protein 27 [Acanthaster planci]